MAYDHVLEYKFRSAIAFDASIQDRLETVRKALDLAGDLPPKMIEALVDNICMQCACVGARLAIAERRREAEERDARRS